MIAAPARPVPCPSLHPLCDAFPQMSVDEFNDLVRSIREHGFHADQPVVFFQGKILDGRNRWRAASVAGVAPATRQFEGDEAAALAFVESRNLHRRNLTPSQKAAVAAALVPFHQAAAKERQRQHGGTAPGRPANTPCKIAPSVSGRAVEAAAAAVGVSPRYVAEASRIAAKSPEVAGKLKAGELTLSEAKRLTREPQKAAGGPDERDEAGRAIHPRAAEALAGADVFDELISQLHAIKRRALELPDDGLGREIVKERFEREIRNAITALKFAKPYTSCPMHDPCTASCKLCRGLQWITKEQFSRWEAVNKPRG